MKAVAISRSVPSALPVPPILMSAAARAVPHKHSAALAETSIRKRSHKPRATGCAVMKTPLSFKPQPAGLGGLRQARMAGTVTCAVGQLA